MSNVSNKSDIYIPRGAKTQITTHTKGEPRGRPCDTFLFWKIYLGTFKQISNPVLDEYPIICSVQNFNIQWIKSYYKQFFNFY